jgi:hypothetical protein
MRGPAPRPPALGAALALLATLCACGDDPAPAPTTPAAAPAPAEPVGPPEREVITTAEEEYLGTQVLEAREVPKAVGEVAPPFPALAEKRLSVVVFFRGEW